MKKIYPILSVLFLIYWGCEDKKDEIHQLCNIMGNESLKSYANENWTLANWVNNRFNPPNNEVDGIQWSQLSHVQSLITPYSFIITANENLEESFGVNHTHNSGAGYCIFNSDSLESHPDWVSMVEVVRDSNFYVNLSKYDYFIGGWQDTKENWYLKYVVGDSSEIEITTPMRETYLEKFPDCD